MSDTHSNRGLLARFIAADVQAAVQSLDEHPSEWDSFWVDDRLFHLTHRVSGVQVWAGNSAYGTEISIPHRGSLWGGVTVRSTFGLSPSHWALWNAIKRWRRNAPAPSVNRQTVASLLGRRQAVSRFPKDLQP
jgi:hypothetical protein